MTFFYHTPLGMIYFIILFAVCLLALWRGGKDNRLYSYCVLGVFLADRTLLFTMGNGATIGIPGIVTLLTDQGRVMIFLGGVAEFIAFIFVIFLGTAIVATRVIAFLFAMKMIAYMCLLSGLINFGTMAAWTELAGYLQLLIIFGSSINADRGKLSRHSRNFYSGIGRVLASYKSKVRD